MSKGGSLPYNPIYWEPETQYVDCSRIGCQCSIVSKRLLDRSRLWVFGIVPTLHLKLLCINSMICSSRSFIFPCVSYVTQNTPVYATGIKPVLWVKIAVICLCLLACYPCNYLNNWRCIPTRTYVIGVHVVTI